MADIYAFPLGASTDVRAAGGNDGGTRAAAGAFRHRSERPMARPYDVPDVVWDAVLSVERMPRVSGVAYREIPVPADMASFGIGVELMRVDDAGDALAAFGWITVLYSREYREDWRSRWRCVAFASMPAPDADGTRPAPAEYWTAMVERLDAKVSEDISGTVTIAQNTAFGGESDVPRASCELRVSWTPLDYADGGLDAGSQVDAWARFLRHMT